MRQTQYPAFLEEAFAPGYRTEEDEATLEFYPVALGPLHVPRGRLTACDPLTYSAEYEGPFAVDFPTGRFPVELAVAKIADDERVGFARVKFGDQPPLRWEMALCEGQNLADLEPDDIYGYGVDSGTGAFFDLPGGRALAALTEAGTERLVADLNASYAHTRSWLLWEPPGEAEANVALFSSGAGDGFYASYVGYAADGSICRLVTDFGLLAWESEAEEAE